VEHPVTEWRTGLDLVREQLRIAAGLPLEITQEQVSFRGHAIEARITAEDPLNRFLPASGLIAALNDPAGPGVRLDSGIYPGMSVPLFYDSLLAKLICWGQDRGEALARLRRALDEYTIAGVRTTIPFHQWLLRQPAFIAGEFSTDFIADTWHPADPADGVADVASDVTVAGEEGGTELTPEEVAVLAATLASEAADQAATERRRASAGDGEGQGSRWRAIGRRSAMGGW
jgi:acetyl/propionyl-CoA carboxylase alpha subunit